MQVEAREHRMCRIPSMPDWLALGWLPLPSLEGTHHGHWSVHCVWICDCRAPDASAPARTPLEGWSLRNEVADAMKAKSAGMTGRQLDQCWLELADVAIERVLAAVADEPTQGARR